MPPLENRDVSPVPKGPRMLSILRPDEVEALGGLPDAAIAGVIDRTAPGTDSFRPNPAFAELMHRVIGEAGPTDAGVQSAARAQQDGWVYVIDLRTPEGPMGSVPPEDIVGGFEVRGGEIIPGSYWPNPNHRLFTENGLVVLPPALREAIVAELNRGAT